MIRPFDRTGGSYYIDAAVIHVDTYGVIRCEGRLFSRSAAEKLESYLTRLHATALAVGTQVVTVDLVGLEWVNERAVGVLVRWVMLIEREPSQKRYRVTFRINRALAWQRGTFEALRAVATELVTLEYVER